MTIDEFETQVQTYARVCHERDRRLVIMFAVALILLVCGILTLDVLPRIALLALIATSFLIIFGEGVYIMLTSRAFHRSHAPVCPRCARRLAMLQIDLKHVGMLSRILQRPDIDGKTRELIHEHIRHDAALRCKRCGEVVIGTY